MVGRSGESSGGAIRGSALSGSVCRFSAVEWNGTLCDSDPCRSGKMKNPHVPKERPDQGTECRAKCHLDSVVNRFKSKRQSI